MNEDNEQAANRRRRKRSTRLLNTNGCCFLCLKVAEIKKEVDYSESANSSSLSPVQPISLKNLHRYLKISTKSYSVTLPEALSAAEESCPLREEEINVELCEICKKVVSEFSKSFLALEKLEMEVNYWVDKIHKQISEGLNHSELVHNYSQRMLSMMTSDDDECATSASPAQVKAFVDGLRSQISEKSSKIRIGFESKVNLFPLPLNLRDCDDPLLKLEQDDYDSLGLPSPSSPSSPVTVTPKQEPLNPSSSSKIRSKFRPRKTVVSKLSTSTTAEALPSTGTINNRKRKRLSPTSTTIVKKKKKVQKGKYPCPHPSCSRILLCPAHVSSHYDVVHLQIRKFQCDTCGTCYASKWAMEKHNCKKTAEIQYRINPSTKKFPCPLKCNTTKEYSSWAAVKYHVELVHIKKKRNCDLCNLPFYTTKSLERHKKTCEFNLETNKKKALNKEDDTRKLKWPCPTCGRKFSRRNSMRDHLQAVHLKERKYPCDECEKGFFSKRMLNDHKHSVHLGTVEYCKYCTKYFKFGSNFRKHKRECGRNQEKEKVKEEKAGGAAGGD